ncbi:MAG: hypothetical protein GWP05_10085, partial [Anaerolineaceae bacterium]|nr:hypothetical protein [Anaerolineaceae bacterium]
MVLATRTRMAWVAWVVAGAVLAWVVVPGVALAQEAAAGNGPVVNVDSEGRGVMGLPVAQVSAELQEKFQQMVHYYKIAKFDLAKDFAEAVLAANPEPTVLLSLVEQREVGYVLIAQMAASEEAGLAAAANRLLSKTDEGILIKRKDLDRIKTALLALDKNERSYQINRMKLQLSGEYVVPTALALLADDKLARLHDDILRALEEIDRPVVYPLVVALETPDAKLKMKIIALLSRLGYKLALPALKAIVESPNEADNVKSAAGAAINAIAGAKARETSAGQLYFELAEAFYYDKITVITDPKRRTTDVWGWIKGAGLTYRPAPTGVVNEILAARCCRLGLRAAADSPELVALWLSAQAQMNFELAGRGKNPWAPPDMPTTEFFLRSAGQQYLNQVLARALRDNRVEVANQAIAALTEVVNEGYLGATSGSDEGSPLIRALEYP